MHQMLNLPDWLPWWIPLILLLPTLLWALSFLFMPFSVFGVKSRLDAIEARLDEIQNDLRHVSGRIPQGGVPSPDYDDVYPARMAEPRPADRILNRPPVPPARHELYTARDTDFRAEPRSLDPNDDPARLEDRPPPPPNARPARRAEVMDRPVARAEPRLDWRR